MQTFRQLTRGNKKYFLVPVMPTPNGGLHLGHLSGPFLKMDVLARAQRRNGNETCLFFGTDVYESYMNLKAWQTGKDEQLLCDEYNTRIKADLNALHIEYDEFINPLDEEHTEKFHVFFTTVLNELVAKGATEIRSEQYLYAKDQDCFLTGCWINGICPVCGNGTGSYQCEECGTQYRPMDLIAPSFKNGNYPITDIDDKDLYLVVRKKEELFQHLENMQVSAEFIAIIKTYFNKQGDYIRLTNPGKWGVPYSLPESRIPHVIFTYTALYFYSLYCGELYKEKFGTTDNPFDKKSAVITVASFGIDCTVPYLAASVALGLEGDNYKPFDFILPNHFFTLENAKFSTSRGHAIWGADIINKTSVSIDAIRYFLVLYNPEYSSTDFSVDQFLEFVNEELAHTLQPLLKKAIGSIREDITDEPDNALVEKLERLLIQQNNYLTPPGFNLKESSVPLQEWIDYGLELLSDAKNTYWWLKGFALLAFPIMPVCAGAIWKFLGHGGEPLESDYFSQTQVNVNIALPVFFKPIDFEDIRPALPLTLFADELK
jgi:methionyl-tRNA synthetase